MVDQIASINPNSGQADTLLLPMLITDSITGLPLRNIGGLDYGDHDPALPLTSGWVSGANGNQELFAIYNVDAPPPGRQDRRGPGR